MRNLIILAALIAVTSHSLAQRKTLTIEDAELGYWKGLYPTSLNNLQWLPNSSQYSYIKYDGENPPPKTSDTLFVKNISPKSDHSEYIITTGDIKAANPEAGRFFSIDWLSATTFVYSSAGEYHLFDVSDKSSTKLFSIPENAENTDHGKTEFGNLAYTIDNDLYVGNAKNAKQVVFESRDENIVTGQAIHRFEFGISKGTFWSPAYKKLAFYQKDETNVASYPLLDINETPGKLNSIKYPMAGQASEHGKVGIYDLQNDKVIFLKTGKPDDHYLTNLAWSSDAKYILLAEINRDQNHMWLNQYDANSGKKVKTLFEEKNEEWTEPEHPAIFIPNSDNEFLWLSERDGFMNLYHYNLTGKLISKLTDFKWPIDEVIGFSKNGKTVYISGTSEDARQKHTYAVNIKSKKVIKLTEKDGTHNSLLSPNGLFFLDSWSSLTIPNKVDLISTKNGKVMANLHTAKDPLEMFEIGETEFVDLTAEDGTKLHGRIIKPVGFNSKEKHPVLVYVYGGPHAQLVTNNWLGGARLWMHYMAAQGYIVFTVDGRGSARRGYEFESVIHRQLGEVEMKDQLVGVEYLKSLPYVDEDRMAVHGWSFGGFMTTSLMTRKPGTFTCGVAGGPVIDWKWYEVMYGERYMDTPKQNPEGYKNASLLNYVSDLTGDLLLIHGTSDDVVVMQHNLAFVQEAVNKGVQLDFFLYPMHKHNVRGMDRVHLTTKMMNYILEHNVNEEE